MDAGLLEGMEGALVDLLGPLGAGTPSGYARSIRSVGGGASAARRVAVSPMPAFFVSWIGADYERRGGDAGPVRLRWRVTVADDGHDSEAGRRTGDARQSRPGTYRMLADAAAALEGATLAPGLGPLRLVSERREEAPEGLSVFRQDWEAVGLLADVD